MSTSTVKSGYFKAGQTLTIVGVPDPKSGCFAVNIGPNDEDIALHVNPRFNHSENVNKVVCNSFKGGNWGEEVREGGFPFCRGVEFKIIIYLTPREFVVTLPDFSNIHFPNRLGADQYSVINIRGDVHITKLEIK